MYDKIINFLLFNVFEKQHRIIMIAFLVNILFLYFINFNNITKYSQKNTTKNECEYSRDENT